MLEEYGAEIIEEISKYFFEELSKYFFEKLSKYDTNEPILFDNIDSSLLKKILFKFEGWHYSFRSNLYLYEKIDFSNVSFDNVYVSGINFTGFRGVKIDPQKVYNKDLSETILCDVEIVGSFDGVDVRNTDFTGSKGAKIDPQKVWKKDLCGTKLCNAEIIGSFDDVYIEGTDFTRSKGALVDLTTVKRNLNYTNFCDATVVKPEYWDDLVESYSIYCTKFDGSEIIVEIDPQASLIKKARIMKNKIKKYFKR